MFLVHPQNQLKRVHRARILNLFLTHQPLSRRALADLTGLSSPTVTNLVFELLDAGVIRETGLPEVDRPRVGRPRQPLELNPRARVTLALHLGSPESAMGLVDLQGRLIASQPIPHDQAGNGSVESLRGIAEQARDFMAAHAVAAGQLLGVGAGVPRVPWGPVPVADILTREFPVPVIVGNNVHAMAVGEYIFALDRATPSMLYLYIGRGIGAGLIVNGQLWQGATGMAGQMVGDIPLPCAARAAGHAPAPLLYQVVTEPAVAEQARTIFADLVDNDDITVVGQVIQRAQDGQAAAEVLLRRVARSLYQGLLPLLTVLNLHVVVIDGRQARADSLLLDAIREVAAAEPTPIGAAPVTFHPTRLAGNAALIGPAALVLMDQFYSSQLMLPADVPG